MNIDEIRDRLQAAPFTPFILRLDNGRRITVQHSETIAVPRHGRFFVVTGARIEIVPPAHVGSSFVVEKPIQRTRKASS
jgi:hypothetical protein